MLKLNLFTMFLIYTIMSSKQNKVWWTTCFMLIIMSLMSLLLMCQSTNILTKFSSTDPMSSSLISLSLLITALMLLSSTKILLLKNMNQLFLTMCMILLITLINAFSSNNLFSFYIWFEASLIPTMIIIITWGYQPERMQASMYMMLYTIMASLPMLLVFIMIYTNLNSTMLSLYEYNCNVPKSMYILLISGFLVKLPMFLTHLWLPKAHVEAPVAGSMVLAAILLKLGGYGICRLMMLFPKKIMSLSPSLMAVSMTGAVITSFICLRQPDLKSLIAYSSVGHMGLMLSGTLSMSSWGLGGTLMMMIAHGLCSSALFSLANINYELLHTRSMFLMKGMTVFSPNMSMWWFMFTAINMAAPPSINLLSEIMLITATLAMSIFFILSLMILTFMTGVYSLNMYGNTQHGALSNFSNTTPTTSNAQNLMLLAHLTPAILIITNPDIISLWS